MKPTILTSPVISSYNVQALFEIYKNLPDADPLITDLEKFYDFLCVNSIQRRQLFDAYCTPSFMDIGHIVIQKLKVNS